MVAIAVFFALTRNYGLAFLAWASILGTWGSVFWWNIRPRRSGGRGPTIPGCLFSIVIGLVLCLMWLSLFHMIDHRMHQRHDHFVTQCRSNIRMIGVALHTYHDTYGTFPPAYIADENGKPIHSWRALLLPFMEGQQIYRQYRWDEPWDGPNNSRLHNTGVPLCQCYYEGNLTNTDYVLVTGPGTLFDGDRPATLADVTDGMSNTVLVIEIANSDIHWMEPRDMPLDKLLAEIEAGNSKKILGAHSVGSSVTFGDLHTKFISHSVDAKTWKAMLTAAGDDNLEEE